MNQRELASVLFAVVGLFVAITRTPELVIHIGTLIEGNAETGLGGISGREMSTIGIVSSLLAILLGASVVLFRDRLAGRLFAANGQPLSAREVQAVGLSVLGCYFVVQGISRFGWGARLDWVAVIQIVLGVGIFFGASGLSGLWMLSRAVGQSRTSTKGAL